jgi:NAD(P)-dependent dehydrogenase (short-subunit alcohol dehydrogenase family)
MSNSEVKDKVAIVTGAAGGLGFGIAARLAEEQAVLLTDINSKLRGGCGQVGGNRCNGRPCDLRCE